MKSASLSPCGTWRYTLGRVWDKKLPRMVWVMLNPSTADDKEDDPTIRQCCFFAGREGYGGITVVNLFAYRATKSQDLVRLGRGSLPNAVGPDNSRVLRWTLKEARLHRSKIVCGWGAKGNMFGAADHFRSFARHILKYPTYCLGVTKDGEPKHPLYIPHHRELEEYTK